MSLCIHHTILPVNFMVIRLVVSYVMFLASLHMLRTVPGKEKSVVISFLSALLHEHQLYVALVPRFNITIATIVWTVR